MATDPVTVIARFRTEVVPERAALVKKALAFEVLNGVTVATPVDTGRARASWNMAVAAPDLSVVPPPAGGKLGRRRAKASIALKPPPAVGFIPPGVPVWITNNLPYIKRLNEGWSKQAPAGFVQRVVSSIQARWDQIVKTVVPQP